jgi:hypothetical protein
MHGRSCMLLWFVSAVGADIVEMNAPSLGTNSTEILTNYHNLSSPFKVLPKPISKSSSVGGGFSTCYFVKITTEGNDFNCMLDTGSTDTILPQTTINNYTGPTISDSIPWYGSNLQGYYGDGSWVNITNYSGTDSGYG